jgi:subtilisin family serine protease
MSLLNALRTRFYFGEVMFEYKKSPILSLFFILFTCSLFCSAGSVSAQTCNGRYVPNEVLVTLTPGTNPSTIATQYGLTQLEQFENLPQYRFAINDKNLSPCTKATQMLTDTRVLIAGANHKMNPPEESGIIHWSGDPYRSKASASLYQNQWALQNINFSQIPTDQNLDNRAIAVVAVLDTGIDLNHPVFAGKLLPGKDFVDNDDDPSEEYASGSRAYGHGTHVAGIIALIAPNAKILPIRVLDENGIGDEWQIKKALRFVAKKFLDDMEAPAGDDRRRHRYIINLSFSTPDRPDGMESTFHSTTNGREEGGRRNDLDIVAAVAAGNKATNEPYFPAAESACEEQILGVAAHGMNNELMYFSNFSSLYLCDAIKGIPRQWVNIMAPGYRIVSTIPGGGFGVRTGTSMSAPFIAGLAARIRAKFPSLEAEDVNCQILSTAITNSNPNAPRRMNPVAALTGSNPLPQCD